MPDETLEFSEQGPFLDFLVGNLSTRLEYTAEGAVSSGHGPGGYSRTRTHTVSLRLSNHPIAVYTTNFTEDPGDHDSDESPTNALLSSIAWALGNSDRFPPHRLARGDKGGEFRVRVEFGSSDNFLAYITGEVGPDDRYEIGVELETEGDRTDRVYTISRIVGYLPNPIGCWKEEGVEVGEDDLEAENQEAADGLLESLGVVVRDRDPYVTLDHTEGSNSFSFTRDEEGQAEDSGDEGSEGMLQIERERLEAAKAAFPDLGPEDALRAYDGEKF